MALKEYIAQNLGTLSADTRRQYDCGILVGAPKLIVLTSSQLNDVKFWVQRKLDFIPSGIPQTGQSFPRLLKSNNLQMATTYRTGETIVLEDYQINDQEWVLAVSQFVLYGPI